jgi:hypothetical protein
MVLSYAVETKKPLIWKLSPLAMAKLGAAPKNPVRHVLRGRNTSSVCVKRT